MSCPCCSSHNHHHDECCADENCCHINPEEEEKEERKEKIRNIVLLIWGSVCLITAFILQKVDAKYIDISWSLFSDVNFYSSLSFIAFLLYTVGYLPLFLTIGKEALEEIKEGNFFNENTLMLVATAGAYAINEHPESLFVVLFSIVGETLEDYATSKSKRSIKKLVNNMPLYAHYIDSDGKVIEKEPEELQIGDRIEIRPGEKVSVDGRILSGKSSMDLSSINGESLPKDVTEGDYIYSGSINLSSLLVMEVGKEFKDSTLSKIMELVENQEEKKAKAEKFITRFAKIYTPVVLIIAINVFLFGFGFSNWSWVNGGRDWLYKALSILLISCPCALVIAVPITFFAGIGSASKYGILIKGSIALENLSKTTTIMFDKTGTLTKGKFALINKPDKEAHHIAASLESKSTHPLAKVITESYKGDLYQVEDLENNPGYGIKGVINNETYLIGNKAFLEKNNVTEIKEEETPFKVLYLAKQNGPFIASFIVADEIKEEAIEAISSLKKEGYQKTVMLSGDDKRIAEDVALKIHLDEAQGQLLPDEKLEVVKQAANASSMVAYVGDGINDSPSILAANAGIAMGGLGSDAAIEASDIVIMDDNLKKVAEAKHLAKKTMTTAKVVIFTSIALKLLFMILVVTGLLGKFAMIVSGLSDTGVMIICVLIALSMSFYKPKYLKKQ
jgi:Cd2+/Zn2+-exporting ATPase